MNRGERHVTLGQGADRRAYGFGDIKEFQIDENLLALSAEPVNELEIAAGHEQLHADLVKTNAITQFFDQGPRLGRIRHVQRNNQALFARHVNLGTQIGRRGRHTRLRSKQV